jgi:glucosamine--fructose-6-phosphate aminotransferase (isomerizing)
MCGIVGYCGEKNAPKLLLEGLRRLEYRGYDSAGIAIPLKGAFEVAREVGLVEKLAPTIPSAGKSGIGHTRWATHGGVTKRNAHPHLSCDGKVAVVHNGILSNFLSLKEQLIEEGHMFASETDTEVLAHMLEAAYKGNIEDAFFAVLKKIQGTFAIAVMHASEPDKVIAARSGPPLVVGLGDGENFLASDVTPLLEHTKKVFFLDDGHAVVITKRAAKLYDFAHKELKPKIVNVPWDAKDAEKGGYDHFMLKEIYEQPSAIHDVLLGRADATLQGRLELDGNLTAEVFSEIDRVMILACGTSYHAGLIGKRLFEDLAGLPVDIEIASEYRYAETRPTGRTLAIAITQSGETADTIAALQKAKRNDHPTLAITNVVGSTITRVADATYLIRAGPEVSVAATKSFTNQLISLYLVAAAAGVRRGSLAPERARTLVNELKNLPRVVQRVIDKRSEIETLANSLAQADHIFYIGRGPAYPVALEGALKMKEISYIHAEGLSAGELKHGPLALLTPKTPVVALVPPGKSYEAMMGNIAEVRARNAVVLAVTQEGEREVEKVASNQILIPKTDELLFPVPAAVLMQLLAYFAARKRGCEIDRPRNLAKSVTVE